MTIKFQVVLKNGKNGSKLFDSKSDIQKVYNLKDIDKIIDIIQYNEKNTLTGARNTRGKQFLNRKNKLNRVVAI